MTALTRRRLLTNAGLLTLTAASAGVLGACGLGAENRAPGAPGSARASSPASQTASATAQAWQVPDPRSLTGLSQAEEIGDCEAVTDSPSPQLPVTLTDADSHEVTVTDVSRILALDLYGTLSRTVAGLGLGGRIVGRGQSSTEPALADLPVVVQGGLEIHVEGVLSLEPTVVLVDHSLGPAEAIDQLRGAGVPVVVLDPQRTLDSVEEDIAAVGQALGCAKEATALAKRARAEVDAAAATIAEWVPADPLRAAFLYVRGNANVFFVLGKGYGADVLIDALGASDVASAAGMGELTPATAEALASLDPEVILTMTGGLESTGGLGGFLARPGVAQTTAGRSRRVVAIPDGQSLTFGPQAGASLLAAASALYQPQPA